MKKTVRVNLGGTAYHIDEDAYAALTAYLHNVKQRLGEDASADEVLSDIERRMSELFTEWMQGHREVITHADVNRVIDILGRPEQYENQTEGPSAAPEAEPVFSRRDGPRRKLYRDPRSAIIAGVTTGLANFFRISPIVFRLIFILLALFGGSGILLYIVCWIVIPEARTASQRLEMEGADVTLDNIERKVREEFGKAKGRVNDYMDSPQFDQNTRSAGYGLGRFFIILAKILVGFVCVVIGLAAFSALMGLLVAFIALLTGGASIMGSWVVGCYPLQLLLGNPYSASWTALGLFLVLALPFVSLFILLFGRTLHLKPTPQWLNWTVLVLWFIGVALIILSAVGVFSHYGHCLLG